MPKKVSNSPSRQPRRPKKRVAAPVAASSPSPVRAAPPPRAVSGNRPVPVRERTGGHAVVDYHYVVNDLKRVGLTAAAMFAVLAVLAVFLR